MTYHTHNDLLAAIEAEERQAGIFEALAKTHRDKIAVLEQQLADLGNGNLSERQVQRVAVVTEVWGKVEAVKLHNPDEQPMQVTATFERFPAVSGVSGVNDYAEAAP